MKRFWALLFLVGCTVDPAANPGATCSVDADCGSERRCYRGFCVVGIVDSGVFDANSTDTLPLDASIPDAGPTDTGEACEPGEACVDPIRFGICRDGLRTCGGAVECITTSSRSETCNQLDDDCDGNTDEDWDLLRDPQHCGQCNRPCGPGLECCGGLCVNTATSATHCGGCGGNCQGETCCGGRCFATETSTTHCGACGRACDEGEVCCGDACADLRTDGAHCGTCPNSCGGGDVCCGGECHAPASSECNGCLQTCGGGTVCCQGSCVDTSSNPDFCGGCGRACGEGELCCAGECFPNDEDHCNGCEPCEMGELCCAAGCVPNNAANCNTCNFACTGGTTCCPDVPSPANPCVDLSQDPQHCGDCATQCGNQQVCSNGQCCAEGRTGCPDGCVNLDNDPDNCNACGRVCGVLNLIPLRCVGGNCRL